MATTFSLYLLSTLAQFLASQAQTTNATCRAEFGWMDNSRGQSPCLVAAYAQGACEADGQWSVQSILNSTVTYSGPDVDQVSLCTCSSVAWALCSACSYCQGDGLPYWSDWIENCPNNKISNGQYPVQVPGGTSIPQWAFQQATGGKFNMTVAYNEAAAAASSVATPSASSTLSANPASSSVSSNAPSTSSSALPNSPSTPAHKINIAPIVGGAVGGGVGAIVVIGLIIWLLHRSHRGPFNTLERPARMEPSIIRLTSPTPPISPLALPHTKFYNPEDPSTFSAADLPTLSPYHHLTSSGYVVDIDPHYPVPPSNVPQV